MKSISVTDAIEKNKLSSSHAYLIALKIDVVNPVDMQVVETLRIVRNSEDVVLSGEMYVATSFSIDIKEESGTPSSISISAVDYSGALQSRMQEYGGGIDFGIEVLIFNSGDLNSKPELREFFKVTTASSKNYEVSFTLGSTNPLSMNFPGRVQLRDRCSWRFKSEECGYDGQLATCDLSLQGSNGCVFHSNSKRYGGFPGINPQIFRYG